MITRYQPVPEEEAKSILGEGIHTGLRKGSEAPSSVTIHRAIANSKDSAWSDALSFCVSGLDSMGLALCRKVEDSE